MIFLLFFYFFIIFFKLTLWIFFIVVSRWWVAYLFHHNHYRLRFLLILLISFINCLQNRFFCNFNKSSFILAKFSPKFTLFFLLVYRVIFIIVLNEESQLFETFFSLFILPHVEDLFESRFQVEYCLKEIFSSHDGILQGETPSKKLKLISNF